jgi:O-methyltransferase
MDQHQIEKLIYKYPFVDPTKLRHLITLLVGVLEKKIPGDVVEMGVLNGGSSNYIRAVLNIFQSDKEFHAYDSWQGVPAPTEHDDFPPFPYLKGELTGSREQYIKRLQGQGLELPIIHSGWFAEIPDDEYPSNIAFAYLDSDLYQSILDSWNKIYERLSPGAVVLVDDYGMLRTPGVKRACDTFLLNKPESIVLCPEPYQGYCEPGFTGGAYLVKLQADPLKTPPTTT